jgi:hypothetical protein
LILNCLFRLSIQSFLLQNFLKHSWTFPALINSIHISVRGIKD